MAIQDECGQTKRESQINSQMGELYQNLDRTKEFCINLDERLNAILTPSTPLVVNEKPLDELVLFANDLRGRNNAVKEVNEILQSILSRIEL